jgi:hypothetical protein
MPPRPGYRRKDYDRDPSRNPKGPQAVEPHSTWQLLVEKSRAKKRLSLRALASAAKIPPGTLFNWVRAKSGTPPYTTYKKPLNTRLASTLEIEPEQLWKAFEESLDAYEKSLPAPAPPAPLPQRIPAAGNSLAEDETPYRTGTLAQLKAMIAATGRQAFTAQEIYAMIDLIAPR